MFTYLKPKSVEQISNILSFSSNDEIYNMFVLSHETEHAQICIEILLQRKASDQIILICTQWPLTATNYLKRAKRNGLEVKQYLAKCNTAQIRYLNLFK